MFKKIRFFIICSLVLLSGCGPLVIVNIDNPDLKILRVKNGFHIIGETTKKANLYVSFFKNIPTAKKFELKGKILLEKGLNPTSNCCFGLKTNDDKSFSFGPRGWGVYLAAVDNLPVIVDSVNKKPHFGDENNFFHTVTIVYDPEKKIFKSYIDDILFGELNVAAVLSKSIFFTQYWFGYNTAIGEKVDIQFKDIQLKM